MIEKLENRRLMDAAITGGSGHAGILVDVHNVNGAIVGTANIDYHAPGWFDNGQGNGNPLTGADGLITVSYNPGQTVQSQMGTVNPDRIIHGGIAGDLRIAAWLKRETDPSGGQNGTIDLDALALANQSVTFCTNACWTFATYFVWDTNCYMFADEAIRQESGYPMEADSCTWDGLMNDLTAAQKWLKTHPVRKVLPVRYDMKVSAIKDFLDKQ